MLTETSREKAVEVAEGIRESFAQMAQDVDGHPFCATLSIGLGHCQERTLDIPSLLRDRRIMPFTAPRSAVATVSRSLRST